MEGRLSRINGRARLAVPIRGIVANRVMEAIITIPYELPEYQQFKNLFTGWIQDHQPSSLMSMELPGQGSHEIAFSSIHGIRDRHNGNPT